MLQVNVTGCHNLIAGDEGGTSDPYCVLKYAGTSRKTKVVKKTLTPTWNASFSFKVNAKAKAMDVEVWDWDAIGKDDFLGRTRVELASVISKDSYENMPYPLMGVDGVEDGDRGTIWMRVRIINQKAQPKLHGSQLANVKHRIVGTLEAGYTELSLESCGLSVLPVSLGERLVTMTKLELSFNQFVQWPDLTPLIQLEELFLNGNLLVNIGPNVSNLRNLRVLRVTGNQLVSLPPEIGKMPFLEVLAAANNQIISVIPEIGTLKKLEELDLSGNPITKLPPQIGGLRNLGSLDLNGCNLTELPEEFTLMTRLIEVNLGNNQLVKLPDGIGRMTRLTVLNLMFNQLTDLPLSIGKCDGLAQLGTGISIAQNPIKNEKMLAKYEMGTDHLFDYLEKRMLEYDGEIEMPEVYLPEDLEVLKEKERRRQKEIQNLQNLQIKFDDAYTGPAARFSVKANTPPIPRQSSSSSFFTPTPSPNPSYSSYSSLNLSRPVSVTPSPYSSSPTPSPSPGYPPNPSGGSAFFNPYPNPNAHMAGAGGYPRPAYPGAPPGGSMFYGSPHPPNNASTYPNNNIINSNVQQFNNYNNNNSNNSTTNNTPAVNNETGGEEYNNNGDQAQPPPPQQVPIPASAPAPIPAPAPDVNSELSTKMVVLKNWAISTIRGEMQPKFHRVNNFLERAEEMAEVMPWAQFAKNIKPELEKGRAFLPLIPTNPHRTPPSDADRLTILKVLVTTVLDDVVYMIDVFYKLLQDSRDPQQILGVVSFLKELKRELGYVQSNESIMQE